MNPSQSPEGNIHEAAKEVTAKISEVSASIWNIWSKVSRLAASHFPVYKTASSFTIIIKSCDSFSELIDLLSIFHLETDI